MYLETLQIILNCLQTNLYQFYELKNSNDSSIHKFDTSSFVQKHYLRINYIESNIEENIYLKINLELKNYLIL